MGHRYVLPWPLLAALVDLLGPGVHEVLVFEHSHYARWHGAAATTRPGRIYLAGTGDEFATDLPFVLHEYCHVLQQWATGRLTRTGYLLECLRRGYWRNRFEVEARSFATASLPRLATLVLEHEQRLVARLSPQGPHAAGGRKPQSG